MTPLLFHKYHGLGNDYLVCERSVAEQLSIEQIRIICHRHYGFGSDGLLIDSGDQHHPTLRIINPDGSEAEKSGNGLRIYARYLFDIGRFSCAPRAGTYIVGSMKILIKSRWRWGGRILVRRHCLH